MTHPFTLRYHISIPYTHSGNNTYYYLDIPMQFTVCITCINDYNLLIVEIDR